MDEKEEKQEPTEDAGDGVQPTADEQVKQLDADTERINKAIAENENAKARQKLSGTADGVGVQEEKKEETAKEYKDRALAGNL